MFLTLIGLWDIKFGEAQDYLLPMGGRDSPLTGGGLPRGGGVGKFINGFLKCAPTR